MPRDDLVLFEEVEASGGKRLGRIILNSPETLNSLTLSMIDLLSPRIDKWDEMKDIVFEAHKFGIHTAAHCVNTEGMRIAVEALSLIHILTLPTKA